MELVCAVCKKPAEFVNEHIVRSCEHSDSPVTANLSARVYGESKVN